MEVETALAKGSMDRVERRDRARSITSYASQDWQALTPAFHWQDTSDRSGRARIRQPQRGRTRISSRRLNAELNSVSLDDLKTYLRWHVVHACAAIAAAGLREREFQFLRQDPAGAKELRPRWKRCVAPLTATGRSAGPGLCGKTFPPEAKARTLKMVNQLEAALTQDISELPWMSEITKKQALVKLAAIQNKIGYPDKWRDYSALKIVRGDALGNSMRANAFEVHRQLAKIGKPVDKQEWQMTPPTVNAYYDPTENDINFPAGILQPPFYDFKADDALNFGGMGAVIGHELTHGFDDQGAQFDAEGNLRDWWTPEDQKAFKERTQCIVTNTTSSWRSTTFMCAAS